MKSLFDFFKRKPNPNWHLRKINILCNEYPDTLRPFGVLDTNWEHFVLNEDGESRNLDENRSDDPFIHFLAENVGGFDGKTVLELGPYEAFHTNSLCKKGAAKIVAIEGNPRNLLKCLIVKNHYQLHAAQFLLGDFLKYLKQTDERFDFILAAGVLYHSAHPIALLNQITAKSNNIGICTSLYDPDNITFQMSGKTRDVVINGTDPFMLYHRTNPTHKTKDSKFGLEKSAWLISEEGLLRFLEFRGFEFEIFRKGRCDETGAHRIRLCATKKR